jgi:hypothetical protein
MTDEGRPRARWVISQNGILIASASMSFDTTSKYFEVLASYSASQSSWERQGRKVVMRTPATFSLSISQFRQTSFA